MSAIFWGLLALIAGWWVIKIGWAFIVTGVGLIFGKYVWDETQNKFIEK